MSAEEENKDQTSTPEEDYSDVDTTDSGFDATDSQSSDNASDSSRTDSSRSSAENSSTNKSDAKSSSKKPKREAEAKGKQSEVNTKDLTGKKPSKLRKLKDKSINHVREGVKSRAKNAYNKIANSTFVKRIKKMLQVTKKVIKFIVSNIKTIGIVTAVVTLVGGLVLTLISWGQASGETPHYYCDLDAQPGLKKTAFYRQYCAPNGGLNFSDIKCEMAYEIGKVVCNEEHILYSLDNNGHYMSKLKEWDLETPLTEAHYICCASFVTLCLYRAGIIDHTGSGCDTPRNIMNKHYSLTFVNGTEVANRETNDGWEYVGGLCLQSGTINMTTDEFVDKYCNGELMKGDVILYRHNNGCPNTAHSHVTLCSGKLTAEDTDDPELIDHWCEIEAAGNFTEDGHGFNAYDPGQRPRGKTGAGTNKQVCENPIIVENERTVEIWRYVGTN